MPLAQLITTVLLCLIAATIIAGSLISAARDADWWVVTRGMTRGRAERLTSTRRK